MSELRGSGDGVDEIEARARRHRALSDVHRLRIVDALRLSDRTPGELATVTGVSSNLLAFHLDVLEEAGLVSRHVSKGDRRRRYVAVRDDVSLGIERGEGVEVPVGPGPLLFLCTGNSARSQLAAGLWEQRTGRPAVSAGTRPGREIHPLAVEVARRHGLDLSAARPRGLDEVRVAPGLVVSVCDRARESTLPFDALALHWSVPPPSDGLAGFERTWALLARRVDRLAEAVAA